MYRVYVCYYVLRAHVQTPSPIEMPMNPRLAFESASNVWPSHSLHFPDGSLRCVRVRACMCVCLCVVVVAKRRVGGTGRWSERVVLPTVKGRNVACVRCRLIGEVVVFCVCACVFVAHAEQTTQM